VGRGGRGPRGRGWLGTREELGRQGAIVEEEGRNVQRDAEMLKDTTAKTRNWRCGDEGGRGWSEAGR
jgi:hypothetical protein